jgi:flagellar biosynthesis/type III secretory pathway protein FliH
MSSMRTSIAEPYAFPRMRKLDELRRDADRAREAQLEAALNDAIARGIEEGIVRGRAQAETDAQALLERSHREGLELGRAEGLIEMREAAAALNEALAQFGVQRQRIVAEAEAFCVDLALAIVARLVATNSARTEFVVSSVQSALKTLAPENPTAVYLQPAVRKRVARAMNGLPLNDDENLASGSARVEAGRLLVQSSIDEAFERIRSAILELKAKRQTATADGVPGGIDASDK